MESLSPLSASLRLGLVLFFFIIGPQGSLLLVAKVARGGGMRVGGCPWFTFFMFVVPMKRDFYVTC